MKRTESTLKADWKLPGIFAAFGEWMNNVSRRVNRVVVYGGQGKWTDDGLQLFVVTCFSGRVYLAGVRYDGLGTKAWVRVRVDVNTVEDHDGPAPNPFPPGEEWYEVAKTSGDIHVTRFG